MDCKILKPHRYSDDCICPHCTLTFNNALKEAITKALTTKQISKLDREFEKLLAYETRRAYEQTS